MDELGLDWETFSEMDINVGTYRYMSDPSTRPLLGAYSLNGGEVYLEDYTETPWLSAYLTEAFNDPQVIIRAYNAAFERLAIYYLFGIWVPVERFRCTMVEAYSLSFFGNMGMVGEQIGIPDELIKMEGGKALINKFCKPAPKNHKVDRYGPENSPEKWEQFKQYNMQDVRAEQAIANAIKPYALNEYQWQQYFIDQRINDRGLPIDLAGVNGAISIATTEKARLTKEMSLITGLDNPNSGQQLMGWLNDVGASLPNLQKETVAKALTQEMPELIREVLELKQVLAKTSVTKYVAVRKGTTSDEHGNKLRGGFQFYGAQRTRRWAGRMFQPHNLPSPKMKDHRPEDVAYLLASGDADAIRGLGHVVGVMPFLSDCIRSIVQAPKGQSIAVCDLSSIESRVLGWHSQCSRLNGVYEQDLDGYKDFGSEFFDVPYDQVTKEQRGYVKPPTLGCWGADTELLTEDGWKCIADIRVLDRVWDGVEFVTHQGVIDQGVRETITKFGVTGTPDHGVLINNRWETWRDLHAGNINRETFSDYGLLTTSLGLATTGKTQVYDLLNVGPRNRYVIRTAYGTEIVHNCGYGLGGVGLVEYASGMGVTMPENDAKRAVSVFREIYPEIPNFWYWLLGKCIRCIKDGTEAKGYGVHVYRDDHFMFIGLPSGEKLCYYNPLVEMIKPPWKGNPAPRETMTYMGRHKTKPVWVRNSTHGGMLVENICQSVARDILMYHITILEADQRFQVIGHVHDEIICLVDYAFREESIVEMERVMSIAPPWCESMLLGASGFYTDRYTKH